MSIILGNAHRSVDIPLIKHFPLQPAECERTEKYYNSVERTAAQRQALLPVLQRTERVLQSVLVPRCSQL